MKGSINWWNMFIILILPMCSDKKNNKITHVCNWYEHYNIWILTEFFFFQGLICETVEEFRESLVNPFAERFLWTDSSPRGPTWSCEDDVILREKYCSGPTKNPSKSVDGAKGLKLILLHNSRYAQTLVS